LSPETFARSVPSPDKSEFVRRFVERGGGVLMVGGYLSFSGIDAKARWGRSPLAAALPVSIVDRDDRVELPSGVEPAVVSEHEVGGQPLCTGWLYETQRQHGAGSQNVLRALMLISPSVGRARRKKGQ
jgi:uncharacterized membrane protein